MLIVDSQVHIWNSGKLPTPIHRQIPVFSKDDLLKETDEAGVDAALLHPPAFDPNSERLQSRRPASIRIGSPYLAGSRSTSLKAGRLSIPGRTSPACSACALFSCNRISRSGRLTARWTGY